jgi:hypothetical protein
MKRGHDRFTMKRTPPHSDLAALGQALARAFKVDPTPGFDALIRAIDEADRLAGSATKAKER